MSVAPYNYDDLNFTFKDPYDAVVNERWDQISQNVYDRSDFANYIIEANWDLSTAQKQSLTILAPVTLKIPDVDTAEAPSEGLPQWR